VTVSSADLLYTVTFTPHDAESAAADELLYQIRTASGGGGTLLTSGPATSGVQVTTPTIHDTALVLGFNARYIRVRDGAGNWTDTVFTVQVVDPTGTPPDEDIELALAGGAGGVVVFFTFEQRNNAFGFIADLTPAVIRASLALDNNRAVVRLAQFEIDPSELPDGFDPNASNVAINGTLVVNGIPVLFTIGLFRLDQASEALYPEDADTLFCDGADLTVLLQVARVDEPYTVIAGASIIAEVRTLCESEGLEHNFPADAYIQGDGTQAMPITRTWGANTPKLTIANELLEAINWFPVYSTERGVQTSRRILNPEDETVAVTYSTVNEPRLVVPPFIRRRNRSHAPNRVTVKINDPLRTLEFATVEDDDPSSPNSTVNTPTAPIEISSALIIDQAMALDIAERRVKEAATTAIVGQLQTDFDPRRKPHETYRLHIEGDEDSTRWRVLSWNLSMENGAIMQHSIGRVIPIETTVIL
jgi:hypothetical protein